MASAITDLVDRVSDSSTGRPIIATLAAPGKAISAGSINLTAATNWTTSSAIHFAIYETMTIGATVVKNPTTQTDWKGTLSGTTISNLTLTGGTDRAYTAGAIAELTATARHGKDSYDWAMNQHNQDGSHSAITATTLTTSGLVSSAGGLTVSAGSVTFPNNSINGNELATNAIKLGYAQITADFTSSSGTAAFITGLTASVTIPAGGRSVKITGHIPYFDAGAVTSPTLSIWDGTVGSGTQIGTGSNTVASAGFRTHIQAIAVVTPAAGAKTYNLAMQNSGSIATTARCGTTSPGFILVETI